MAKPTKFEGIKRKVHAMISELPLDDQIKAREEIACQLVTDLFNDAVQPRYGVSASDAHATLNHFEVKVKSILRCI